MSKLCAFIVFIGLASALPTHAQYGVFGPWQPGAGSVSPRPLTPEEIEANRLHDAALTRVWWQPKDPWREVAGATYLAKGSNWLQCLGTVIEIQQGKGVRVRGRYALPFDLKPATLMPGETEEVYFIANYPYPVAEGQDLGTNVVAMMDGVYSYHNVSGGNTTLVKLDYGKPVAAPQRIPTAAQREAQSKKTREAGERALAYHQELAAKGDAYGQLRMGQRYLAGDGVKKDVAKGRELLSLAAAQGNKTAADELEKLNKPVAQK